MSNLWVVQLKKFAIVFSETGCDAVVEADSAIEAIRKVNPVLRYSSELCEWPEYDRFTTIEKKGTIKEVPIEKCQETIDWIKKVGKDNRDDGYPTLASKKSFTVYVPTGSDQAIYVYETNHPVCEQYGY